MFILFEEIWGNPLMVKNQELPENTVVEGKLF